MKKFGIILIIIGLFQACDSPEMPLELQDQAPKAVGILDLNFPVLHKTGKISDEIEVISAILLENPDGSFDLAGDNITKGEAINTKTGLSIYVYGLSAKDKGNSNSRIGERGYYGFDGECFIYGTLYEGDNGVDLFVPASLTTQLMGFAPVCLGPGQSFA